MDERFFCVKQKEFDECKIVIMKQIDTEQTNSVLLSHPRIDEEPQNHNDPDTTKRKDAFSKISRELSEADLKSPGTQRMLLRDLDNYEDCKKKLEDLREKYHRIDRENGVYEVKLAQYEGIDYLYSFLLSIGSALIGLFPTVWTSATWYLGTSVGVLGLTAFVASVIIKHRNVK